VISWAILHKVNFLVFRFFIYNKRSSFNF